MANIGVRIWKRVRSTFRAFRTDCYFSKYFAILRILDELGGRVGLKKIAAWAHNRKDRWIIEYLNHDIYQIIEKYHDCEEFGIYEENAPIWVCWWTGMDHAPELVKRCVESTHRNAGNHPVYLISEETYSKYLEIPGFMLEKVKAGTMGLAHLADYIRVKLLADYGGLWLDATIFSSGPIPDICFALPIFTCKGPIRKGYYLSDYRWATFCLGGWKGNVFYRTLSEIFEAYWLRNDYAVDYLFFDHIILSLYEHHPAIRKFLEDIPDNNIHRDDLQAAMNAALPAEELDNLIQKDTVLYKLSWRETYTEKNTDGIDTIYARFIHSNTKV